MTQRTLLAVTAGLSQPSSTRLLADRLVASTAQALTARGDGVSVEVVELREHAEALAGSLLTGFPSGGLRRALDSVLAADGVVAVSPVFNASYSGLFKMFFDVLPRGSLTGTPVLMAATGGSPRHALVLEHSMRPMFAHLQAMTVPTAVYATAADWGAGGEHALGARIDRAGQELARLVALADSASVPADDEERVSRLSRRVATVQDLLAG